MLPALFSILLISSPEEPARMADRSGIVRACRPRAVVLGLHPRRMERLASAEGRREVEAAFARGGALVADHCEPLGLFRLEVPEGEDLAEACHRFGRLEEVRYAEPDWYGEGGYTPDDPFFADAWQLHQIEAPAAWDLSRGSSGIIVAILDTGIVFDHPEFLGRTIRQPAVVSDFVNRDDDPAADHPHGVSTAGILAANANNETAAAGVDHFARILPVKILNHQNLGTDWDLVQGLRFAADQGARVISMSLINYPESDAVKDALRYAREKGAVLVACAGNQGTGNADVSWPGASPLCITVGATGRDDRRAGFSGTGNALDVVAPGRDLVTVAMDPASGSIALFSGCSAAVPVVSGIASLLLAADPELTADQVQDLIHRGAEDGVGGVEDPPGWDPNLGWGRVNARRSLELVGRKFRRGDANHDGDVDISDALYELFNLFAGKEELACRDAGDANDDGLLDISDPTSILSFLFLGGGMPLPFPACGLDISTDGLDCALGCGSR